MTGEELFYFIFGIFCYYIILVIGYALSLIDILCDFVRDGLTWVRIPNLEKRHVVISGCDSGFGYEGALALAKLGLHVHAGCYTRDGFDRLGQKDAGLSLTGKLLPFMLDITSNESVSAAKLSISDRLPDEGLWALINNAGYFGVLVYDEYQTMDDYRNLWEINCAGHIRMIHAFRPLMNEDIGGRIINMISLYGHGTVPNVAPYASAKYAMLGYTSALRTELWGSNIDVISVSPGLVSGTNLTANYFQNAEERYRRLEAEGIIKYDWSFIKRRHKSVTRSSVKMDCMNSPQYVADAYMSAATARYPRQHYYVGIDGHFASHYAMTTCRTQNWLYSIIRWYFGDILYGEEKKLRNRGEIQ